MKYGRHAFVREALFGGRGRVWVWNLLDRHAGPFREVLACEMEPGGSVGPHVQVAYDEIVVFTEGTGVASVDGAPTDVGAGSVVWLPRGATLALENRSTSNPLQYLIIKAALQPNGAPS